MKKIVFNLETDTNLDAVDKQIKDITGSTENLTKQYKEMKKAALEATDPEEFKRLAKAAGELKDRITDTQRQINNFASDTRKLDVVVGSVRGITGAFAALQGTMALLGGENENLQKTLVKVQGSLAVLNGVQEVSRTLNKDSATGVALLAAKKQFLNVVIGKSTGALKAFRIALAATGVGAFVVLLGLLITNWEKITDAIGGSTKKQEKFIESQKEVAAASLEAAKNLSEQEIALRRLGATEEEIRIEREQAAKRAVLDAQTVVEGIQKQIDEAQKKLDRRKRTRFSWLEFLGVSDSDLEKLKQNLSEANNALESALNVQFTITQGLNKDKEREEDEAFEREIRRRRTSIELLDDGLRKRIQLIRLNYDIEKRAAIKNGDDIVLIEKKKNKQIADLYEEERQRFINDSKALQVELEKFTGVSTDELVQRERDASKKRADIIEQRVKDGVISSKQGDEEIVKNFQLTYFNIEKIYKDADNQRRSQFNKMSMELLKGALDDEELIKKIIKNMISEIADDTDELVKKLMSEFITMSNGITTTIIDTNKKGTKEILELIELTRKSGELKQKEAEEELKLSIQTLKLNALEKADMMDKLQKEDFYLQRRQDLMSEYGFDFTSQQMLRMKLRELDRKDKEEQLKNEVQFLNKKLDILEEDPTLNPDEYQRVVNRIREISLELKDIGLEAAEEQTGIISNAIQEAINLLEQNLSAFSQFISAVQSEATQNFNDQVRLSRKALDEGKITQKEFDELQKKSFEENEKRQRELFKQQQQIEITRTIISGISSAQQAYQSQFLPVPDPTSPVRGAVAAGLALAAMGVRVAAIKKQKYRGGEEPSSSLGNVGGGRVFGGVGTGGVIEPTLRNDLDQSLRVFVLEGDISNAQRRVRVIRGSSNATF